MTPTAGMPPCIIFTAHRARRDNDGTKLKNNDRETAISYILPLNMLVEHKSRRAVTFWIDAQRWFHTKSKPVFWDLMGRKDCRKNAAWSSFHQIPRLPQKGWETDIEQCHSTMDSVGDWVRAASGIPRLLQRTISYRHYTPGPWQSRHGVARQNGPRL